MSAGLASARMASSPVQRYPLLAIAKECSGLAVHIRAALLAPAAASSTSAAFVAWPGLASSSSVLSRACSVLLVFPFVLLTAIALQTLGLTRREILHYSSDTKNFLMQPLKQRRGSSKKDWNARILRMLIDCRLSCAGTGQGI